MTDYKQYTYSGPDELWYNFSGRYTKINQTSTGVIFNSSSSKYAKVSGMLLSEKIQGYKYKTYIIKVVAAALTENGRPYIYTGFSQNVADRVIIGPPMEDGTYLEYSVQFTLPETQLFDFGVFFSQKNNVINTVEVISISLSCIEDDYYVLTHKDTVINSNKDFSGDSITVKKIILDQIEPTGNLNLGGNGILGASNISTQEIVLNNYSILAGMSGITGMSITNNGNVGIIYDSQFNRPSIPTLTQVCNASKDPNTNIVSAGNQVIGDILELDMHNWQNTKRVVIGIGDTGAFNITKTEWADKLGEIYDSYYNKPPFISTATAHLNMGSNDITYLNEIDMVGADNSTIALSIDPITKLIRYTTGQWLLDGNDNYGIIYDTKFNLPVDDGYFKKNSVGALDMNSNNIIGVGQIGISGNTIQAEPGTSRLCYTKSTFVTGYGVIYDSLYNKPPFIDTATAPLWMGSNAINNTTYISFVPNGILQPNKPILGIESSSSSITSGLNVRTDDGAKVGLIYDSQFNHPFNYINGVTNAGSPITFNAKLNLGRSLLKAQFVMSSGNPNIFLCFDQLLSYSWNDTTFTSVATTPIILGSQGITGTIVLSQSGDFLVITIGITGYTDNTPITWALTYTSTCTLSSS
jgi:hypothetical protein